MRTDEHPDDWTENIERWLTWLRAGDTADGTIKLRRIQIRRLATTHPGVGPWDITGEHIATWLARYGWGAETKRSHRAAARSFYHWATIMRRRADNPALTLPRIKPKQYRPRPASEDTIRLARKRSDARDDLMIRLGAELGLRACEIATVHTDHLTHEPDGWTLRVLGKGQKIRDVPVPDELTRHLRRRGPGWVFPGRVDGHLSARYVSKRLSWALGPGVTGHQLRHRFASAAYAAEQDIRAVQDLLGHASPETTARYTHVPDVARRRAVTAVATEVA